VHREASVRREKCYLATFKIQGISFVETTRKEVSVFRFLFGLLIGAIVGVAGTAYFFSMGGGDYLLVSSPRVNRLEHDLQQVTQEREQVAKKLEETTTVVEKMTTRFTDLERRFHTLEALSHGSGEEQKSKEPETPQDTPSSS